MKHILIGVAVLILVAFAESKGQELRIGPSFNHTDHTLLENPMGLAFAGGVRLHPRIGIRVGYESSQDQFRSFGSTCLGLIPPEMEEDCAGEDREEESAFKALGFSVPVTILSSRRFDVDVVPSYRRASIESDQTGVRSDRRRNAEKDMSGIGIGAEIHFQPQRWQEFTVFLGAHQTRLIWYEDEVQIDGYSPFEEDVTVTSIMLGVSYRR